MLSCSLVSYFITLTVQESQIFIQALILLLVSKHLTLMQKSLLTEKFIMLNGAQAFIVDMNVCSVGNSNHLISIWKAVE